ncbi:MAG: glutamate--tRNA ligase, partial [Bdellovibrionales bacterium]|nr:glutamate--tRNA ligase [Bdellovibrionales bacterium]
PSGGEFGPYIQSLRRNRYKEIADMLVASGHAYRCDCTAEMLAEEREKQKGSKEVPGYSGRCRDRSVPSDVRHVVRFRMPEPRPVSMNDAIRGNIEWERIPLRDPVLMKSDGFPTYHLAVVVDDHDMEITHVLRGEEWIPSAPLHILLYEALGWEPPTFCHLPVVLGPDRKKLSKRHGSTSWSSFRDEGYLPEAVLNFIVRIGWSPGEGDEQEIFSREELIERFSLEQVNSASAVFEYEKLNWMNGVYIRALSPSDFIERVRPFFDRSQSRVDLAELGPLVPALQERARTLAEVPALVEFLEAKPLHREIDQMISKKLSIEDAQRLLASILEAFRSLESFTIESMESALNEVAVRLEMKAGNAFLVTRIATLGKKATPPLFESLLVMGRGLAIERIEETLESCRNVRPD